MARIRIIKAPIAIKIVWGEKDFLFEREELRKGLGLTISSSSLKETFLVSSGFSGTKGSEGGVIGGSEETGEASEGVRLGATGVSGVGVDNSGFRGISGEEGISGEARLGVEVGTEVSWGVTRVAGLRGASGETGV